VKKTAFVTDPLKDIVEIYGFVVYQFIEKSVSWYFIYVLSVFAAYRIDIIYIYLKNNFLQKNPSKQTKNQCTAGVALTSKRPQRRRVC